MCVIIVFWKLYAKLYLVHMTETAHFFIILFLFCFHLILTTHKIKKNTTLLWEITSQNDKKISTSAILKHFESFSITTTAGIAVYSSIFVSSTREEAEVSETGACCLPVSSNRSDVGAAIHTWRTSTSIDGFDTPTCSLLIRLTTSRKGKIKSGAVVKPERPKLQALSPAALASVSSPCSQLPARIYSNPLYMHTHGIDFSMYKYNILLYPFIRAGLFFGGVLAHCRCCYKGGVFAEFICCGRF